MGYWVGNSSKNSDYRSGSISKPVSKPKTSSSSASSSSSSRSGSSSSSRSGSRSSSYTKRTIGNSTYTVPVGLRSDWKPGQPYNISAPATSTSVSAPVYSPTPAPQMNAAVPVPEIPLSQYAPPAVPQYTPPAFQPYVPPPIPTLSWEDALRKASSMIAAPGEMSWEDALRQAGEQVNPMYGEAIKKALATTQEDLVRRGFFGQLPGLAVTADTQARMEAEKQGKAAELARLLQQSRESQVATAKQQQLGLAEQMKGATETEAQRLSNIALQNWQAQNQAAQAAAENRYNAELKRYEAGLAAQEAQQKAAAEALKAEADKSNSFWKNWQAIANVTGYIPPMSEGDPSAIIRYAQELYADAERRGDQAGMNQAHQMAESARKQAGWETGDLSGAASQYRMTQAGLPTSETTKSMLPYQYPSANTMVPYQYGPTPAQMLPYQYPSANTMVPYQYGATPYQQGQLDLGASKVGSDADSATNMAIAELGKYGSKQEALSDLQQYGPKMVEQGVNIAKLYDMINKMWPYE